MVKFQTGIRLDFQTGNLPVSDFQTGKLPTRTVSSQDQEKLLEKVNDCQT